MERNSFLRRKLRYIKENLKIRNNCWNCIYHKAGGINLFGKCNWWFLYKNQDPKEIPNTIIDKGCRFWKDKVDKFHPLLKQVIQKFNGELIE